MLQKNKTLAGLYLTLFLAGSILITGGCGNQQTEKNQDGFWIPADTNSIRNPSLKHMVAYGRELVAHTGHYFGPTGSINKSSNGMNCQNCHLQAGTVVFGNNFGSVASLYPKFRDRSGQIENVYKRINDCFERSLNGRPIDTMSREMKAIASYIQFIGSNVPRGIKAFGSGLGKLAFLDRAADTILGRKVYTLRCQSCHQQQGEGALNTLGNEFLYPALWGGHSFNDGAGLLRLINLAGFVKYNMPFGANYRAPLLSDEEAWDVAAYICSQPRPHFDYSHDWPNLSKKPIDYPFGPYRDSLSENRHRYGPFSH
jgi:thiosulfate dehydrogenase